MTTIEPLTHQIAHGQYAAQEVRAAENMMSLIAQWDNLTGDEKNAEWEKQGKSRFFEVPGFEPVFCHDCGHDVFVDFREYPEGECPFGTEHDIWSAPLPDRIAA